MMTTSEQFVAAHKSNLDAVQGLSSQFVAGFEKLVELNLAAAKAMMAESFSHAQALLGAKDMQQVMALQTGFVAPMAEKSVAYSRHVYNILTETTSAFSQAFEGKAAEAKTAFEQALETAVKSAPVGTESAVAVLKSALESSQNAIESAQASAKQALSMAESNIAAVTEQALSAAASVAKKA